MSDKEEKSKGNVFQLLQGNAKTDELKNLLKILQEQMPIQMQIQIEMAKLTRHKYLQLVGQGFTPIEALEIVKVSPV